MSVGESLHPLRNITSELVRFVRSTHFGSLLQTYYSYQWPLPILDALPSSPFDGQVILLHAGGGEVKSGPQATGGGGGVLWLMVYWEEPKAPTGPWKFVGGPNIGTFDTSTRNTTGTSFAYVSGLPQFTVPYAGDYWTTISTRIFPPQENAHYTIATPGGAGHTAADEPAVLAQADNPHENPGAVFCTNSSQLTYDDPGGSKLEVQLRHTGTTAGSVLDTRLSIRPVRLYK